MADNKNCFELEGKKCGFKRITTRDALEIQHIMTRLAQGKATKDDERELDALALKYLEISNGGVKNDGFTIELLETQFTNPFAIVEINAKFQGYVGGFLAALPSFQNLK